MSPSKPELRGVAILVQDVDALGGSERQARALAETLVRQGLGVLLLTTRSPGSPGASRPWREEAAGIRTYRLPLVGFEALAGSVLRRQARRWEAIYAVGIMMGSIAVRLGRLFGARPAIKLACSGPWGDMAALSALPEGVRGRVQAELREAWLVCLTEDIAGEVAAAGFPAGRRRCIPNGVDAQAVRAAAPVQPLGSGRSTILFAGRLDAQKGVDVLLQAFSALEGAELLLAGDGPEAAAMQALARRLGVFERVHFLGRRGDVAGLMRGATLTCLPSRGEGMSNTLLEALSAGSPVVASAIPANVEVVGDAGLLVPGEDPAALAAALQRVLAEAPLRERLARAGPARIAAHFDLERVATRTLELLGELRRPALPGPARWGWRFARARAAEWVRAGLTRLGR